MTIQEKEQDIIEEFALFDDWMDKYEHIIELGKELPILPDSEKSDDQLIDGCQSRVWLKSNASDGKMTFQADSDAIITKGIIALLIRVLNEEEFKTIATAELKFIKEIGLMEHLSPTRSNGLVSMVKRIKMDALMSAK